MLQVRVLPGLVFDVCFLIVGAVMKKIILFFKESYAELKKVTWPSRDEVISSTKVVLVSITIIAIALGIVDYLFFAGMDFIF